LRRKASEVGARTVDAVLHDHRGAGLRQGWG
jgi:hypothetical protein